MTILVVALAAIATVVWLARRRPRADRSPSSSDGGYWMGDAGDAPRHHGPDDPSGGDAPDGHDGGSGSDSGGADGGGGGDGGE